VIRAALDALAAASVPFATRGEQPIDDPPPGGDVDILVGAADADAAERVLAQAGFHRLHSPGHRRHRFYLAFDGRWLKIDVSLVPRGFGWDLSARDEESLRRFAAYRTGTKADPALPERIVAALERRRPLEPRRRGPVVAVLGPDGAGKGSVIAALRRQIQAAVTPVYLGHGETSRAEYRRRPAAPPGARAVRLRAGVRAVLGLLPHAARDVQHRVRRAVRMAARTWAAYLYAWRGDIVLCDRHPLEALAVHAGDRSAAATVERLMLRRLVPWPDAVVLLDAPGDVLYARKGEHSPAVLDGWRGAYRDVFGARNATVVCTTDGLDRSVAQASAVLWRALSDRRGW
jgi:thymidylate kinase